MLYTKKPCDPHILCILSTNLRMWCCWFQVVYKISDNQWTPPKDCICRTTGSRRWRGSWICCDRLDGGDCMHRTPMHHLRIYDCIIQCNTIHYTTLQYNTQQTNKETNKQTNKHACMHTYVRTYVPTYLHSYIPTYLHTYIPTYLHTYIPTYLHTYIDT